METTIEKNNQGVQFFLNRDFESAKKLYEQALDIDAENVTTLNNLGLLYHQLKEYTTAVNYYEKAISIKPKDTYYVNLANSLMFLERQKEAIELYGISLQINPKNTNAKVCLAKAYEAEKKHQEAGVIWETIVSESNEEKHAIDFAKNQMAQGNFNKSLAILMELQFVEENSLVLALIGMCEFNLKNHGLAEEAFKKSLSISPNNGEIRRYLAINYLSKGNTPEALRELKFLMTMFPKNEQAKLDACMVLLNLKEYKEADQLLDEVLQLNKNNAKAKQYKKTVKSFL